MTTVLLIDDEQVVREVLARLLEQRTREILTAAGKEEALEYAAQRKIDVAVVDKNLVGASGLDLARQLKKLQPEMEVILLTGYASLESAVEAVQIGAFDYLTKPIEDYSSLGRKVELAEERAALRRGQRTLLAQLMESEVRFRRLVESSPDALILCEASSGRVLDANPAAVKLYGWTPEELVRLREADLVLADGLHKRKDGAVFTAEVHDTTFTVEGVPVRALSVRDVTERERDQRERRELEERLRLSQKMEAVGRLAGGVAHDFNNLLSVILAHVDFLSSQLQAGSEPMQEVEGIQRAAQRGAALTRQLLLFSRHKPIEPSHIDVNGVVQEVRKLLTRVIGEPVRITTELDPELWPVRADSDQLAQVVLNLAVNARDAMPGGGELAIFTTNVNVGVRRDLRGGELQPGRYACLTVRDQGHGMAPDVLARLFEPFFTTKEQGKGTGLGLATLYGIVQGAGGAVDVESEPGKGSAFFVYLPATEAEDDVLPAGPQKHGPGRGETVLVVEDEEPLRALVRRILNAHGYAVIEGANGREALRTARTHGRRIDLLITDVVMPEMGGRELAEQMAREQPGVRVLFMTGYTDSAVPETAGVTGFIQKPFATAAFLGEVRRLLDRS